jgi:hypothetical protein
MTEPIPAGYQIHFTTWENDGDAYKTQIWSGIEQREDVVFLLALARLFKSQNDRNAGMGNGSVAAEVLVSAIDNLMLLHPDISRDMRQLFNDEREDDEDILADRWYDLICDRILSTPEEECYYSEPLFCRVFSSVNVYYFPQPVEEVTDQFQ